MAYANEASVILICQNLISNPGGLFAVASALCDAQIDADLGNYFFWPYSAQDVALNNPPPAYVQQMANWFTAAIIESMSYAQVQGFKDVSMDGDSSNTTYGRYLMQMYKSMLKALVGGRALVNSLVRYSSIGADPAFRRFRLTLGLAQDVPFATTGTNNADFGGIE